MQNPFWRKSGTKVAKTEMKGKIDEKGRRKIRLDISAEMKQKLQVESTKAGTDWYEHQNLWSGFSLLQCSVNFSENEKYQIFSNFWEKQDYKGQNNLCEQFKNSPLNEISKEGNGRISFIDRK